tara:strand:- start:881 stop:1171 length:291 start_codon:yes stop_codon:yes gene_type:complete
MCLICIDFQKGTLTTTEAWRNLQEMKETLTDEHHDDVVSMIIEKIHDETTEPEGEEDLSNLLEKLEETGQLSFGWDELSLEEEDWDLDYPEDDFEV